MFLLRKYGTGTGADVRIPITKRGVVDFALSADWTPSAGDVKISIDGGAAASITTLPTAVTMGNTAMWVFTFADAELQGKEILVTVSDSATKAVEDAMFIIETYGNASAMYPADLSDGVRLGLTALPNAAAAASGGLLVYGTGTGAINPSSGTVPITSNAKKNQQLTAYPFLMVSSADHLTPLTGLTVSATISKDGGSFAATTNAPTEVANGIYKITLTATELNCNTAIVYFTATAADGQFHTFITQP